jgi:hypothetical protein
MIIHDFMFDVDRVIVIGSSKAISTSKIRKITAIKKNHKENGSRADLLGSNPHSDGEPFSWSSVIFFEIKEVMIIMIIVNANASIAIKVVIITCRTNFLIGSQVY